MGAGAKHITIKLTIGEGKALLTCADDGAEGTCTDAAAAEGYLGGPKGIAAYCRAAKKLNEALDRARDG